MQVERAQGCLLGQLAGDALGSLVEFASPATIRRRYPGGVRELADGGHWNTIAGQPTDDSELALALARTLVDRGTYEPASAFAAYRAWLASGPFDIGNTTRNALSGHPNGDSQANGALMRISPPGIFGANQPRARVAEWARQDAALTHPNRVCLEANALFAMAIADAVDSGPTPGELYDRVKRWAAEMQAAPALLTVIDRAGDAPPADYLRQMGWVLVALQNALYQLRHASSFEAGVVDTVMRGGDTDTNAAICGALLGALYGREAVPEQWTTAILNCRPAAGKPKVHRPRPPHYWPVDALALAALLVGTPEEVVRK